MLPSIQKGSHFLCLRFCAYSHFLVSTVLVPTKLLPTLGCLLFFCPHLWKWRFCAYHLVFDSFIPTVLLPEYSCPLDGKGWICAYPLVEHVFVTTSLGEDVQTRACCPVHRTRICPSGRRHCPPEVKNLSITSQSLRPVDLCCKWLQFPVLRARGDWGTFVFLTSLF